MFTVQDESASVDNANAYIPVATLDSWAADRGIDLTSFNTTEKQVAVVKATDYLDAEYTFVGYQLRRLQGTQFPRGGVTSFLRGIPPALQVAASSLAYRALQTPNSSLMPDPSYDASGQSVVESTKKVGPIEVSTKFSEAHGTQAKVKKYPEITLLLQNAGLIGGGSTGTLVRG